MRRLPLLLTTAVLCGCLAAVGSLDRGPSRTTPPPNGTGWRDTRVAASDGTVARAIATDQSRLHERPDDPTAWARLGALYVEQARLTADPSYYPKADEALHRSLGLAPQANVDALTGLGTLANARHRFAEARDLAERAIAESPHHWQAYAVLADARTQLGDDQGATDAVQALLDRHPGTAAFTRAAYDLEQHGRPADARQALQKALEGAFDPADKAFCRYQIAELDRNAGRPGDALAEYQKALVIDPSHPQALAGKARTEAALGHTDDALRDYASAIGRIPLPQFLLEFGELQESLGHTAEAGDQYRLLAAEQRLAAANGVADDLSLGQYEADHGHSAEAVRLLRGEWQRRQHPLVADALAWALHRQGLDDEALGLAEQAAGHGWRNALFSYHRGEIERALGRAAEARDHLAQALRTDPYFSPLQAPRARAALTALGGSAGTT